MKFVARLTTLIFLTTMLTLSALAQEKKRIAVLDFDYATVTSSVDAIFGTRQDVGKGVADLLVTKLVQSGTYSVIERKQIEKVLAEQNFGASGRVDDATAARIGKILGVDALVMGSISAFGRDDRGRGQAGGVRVPIPGPFGGSVKVGQQKSKAVVGLNFRMINTETAEIIAAGDARGESKRESASISGYGSIRGASSDFGNDMSSSNFADTIIGEAVYDAVGKLTAQLETKAASLPARGAARIEGMIADVTGSTVVLNVGRGAGLKVGDRLTVSRPVKEVKDPATGKVIRVLSEEVGEVKITDVDDQSAVGTFTGKSSAKVKDRVTNEKK